MDNNKKVSVPDIHIGNEIRDYLEATGIYKTTVAKAIGMHPANFGALLNEKGIDTHVLVNICNSLNHNFFLLWCDSYPVAPVSFKPIQEPTALGEIIKNTLYRSRVSVKEFMASFDISRSAVHSMYKRTSIHTDKLADISRITNDNLFVYFCRNEILENPSEIIESFPEKIILDRLTELAIENGRLKQELETAKMQIAKLQYTV